jgi:hypothetical protein
MKIFIEQNQTLAISQSDIFLLTTALWSLFSDVVEKGLG